MKKIKKVFCVLCFLSFFTNIQPSHADTISDGINEIASIINSKDSLTIKENKVEKVVKSLMNYDKFFNHIAGADFWKALSSDEKSKIIERNNREYIKDYFNKITACDAFSVKEIGDPKKQKRLFSYKCNSEEKKLDVITMHGKVVDVQISGVSFIQTEKAKLSNMTNEEKRDILLGNK